MRACAIFLRNSLVMQDAILLRVSITPVKSISEERGGNEKMSEGNEGRGKVRRETERERRRNISVAISRARRGKGRRKNCKSAVEGKTVCGAAGGRGRPYTANPRQPHSITMLSRIQMTVISFGTPYT